MPANSFAHQCISLEDRVIFVLKKKTYRKIPWSSEYWFWWIALNLLVAADAMLRREERLLCSRSKTESWVSIFFFCIIAQDTTIRSFIIFLDPGNYKDETLCLVRLQTGGDTTDLPSVPGVLSQVKYCGKLLYSVLSFLLQEKEETFGGFSFSLPLSQESFASVLSRASVEKSNERW